MKIKVSEIFYSIQGEGSYTGYPFIFLRLGGCNLRCYYCDTKYVFENYEESDIKEVIDKINSFKVKNLLITGGEPLLQMEPLLCIIENLKDFNISIETNGSQSIERIGKNIHIVIDVKTPSSGFSDSFYMENLGFLKPNDDIKFVVSDVYDFNFSIDFIRKNNLHNITKNIIISPNLDRLRASDVAEWILKEKDSHIRLGVQLHKIIGFK